MLTVVPTCGRLQLILRIPCGNPKDLPLRGFACSDKTLSRPTIGAVRGRNGAARVQITTGTICVVRIATKTSPNPSPGVKCAIIPIIIIILIMKNLLKMEFIQHTNIIAY